MPLVAPVSSPTPITWNWLVLTEPLTGSSNRSTNNKCWQGFRSKHGAGQHEHHGLSCRLLAGGGLRVRCRTRSCSRRLPGSCSPRRRGSGLSCRRRGAGLSCRRLLRPPRLRLLLRCRICSRSGSSRCLRVARGLCGGCSACCPVATLAPSESLELLPALLLLRDRFFFFSPLCFFLACSSSTNIQKQMRASVGVQSNHRQTQAAANTPVRCIIRSSIP